MTDRRHYPTIDRGAGPERATPLLTRAEAERLREAIFQACGNAPAMRCSVNAKQFDGLQRGNLPMGESYNFDREIQVGAWVVKVDTDAEYGYFENVETGGEGTLWFDEGSERLTDFDGVFVLPMPVIEALREMGFTVDPDFE